jgi:hypothetical protein
MKKSEIATKETWRGGQPTPKAHVAYLSVEHAQRLAERRVNGFSAAPALRVGTTPEGLWRVRLGGREHLMPPMGLDDWSAWVDHFVG